MSPTTPKTPETPKSKVMIKNSVLDAQGLASRSTSRKSPATLISSLSIPVKGALPIQRLNYGDKDTAKDSMDGAESTTQTQTAVTRTPRKSKTDALAAIETSATSPLADDDIFMDDSKLVQDTFFTSSVPLDAPDTLDLSTVKTSTLAHSTTALKTRPFDLEECPTFYPSREEFADATAYIQSISEVGKQYGICKIVPPEGWRMPFVTDTKTFRFKTRVQRLNQIEAAARAKLNFLEQLYQFHKQQGNARMSIPTINQKPLDLWLLRREVKKMGGYDEITKERTWGDLGRRMGFTGIPGLSTQLKNSYTRVILPFEHYSERVRNSPALSPAANRIHDPQLKTHQNIQTPSRMNITKDSPLRGEIGASPPSSPLSSVSTSSLSDADDADGHNKESQGKRDQRSGDGVDTTPKARTGTSTLLPSVDLDTPKPPRTGEICEVCQKSNRGTEMLLCDGCDSGFHMFCLDPPLWNIPKGEWFCHTCLFGAGEEFGFDEGEEHSLSSFQARDAAFRTLWFEKHPPADGFANAWSTKIGKLDVPESWVESEFWRLVQSPSETVEIEYGADVHSTTHGSAMPTLETHPDDTYSKDSWNLNNLPISSDSLLRYIKSDISGMTVPWTYVGMIFSTFCWHNEDHYTYSINYMHWGETKTWYGIPGGDADNFEAAMRQEAPDLFEAQPDLLFQLVTLMHPSRLRKAGVKVAVCDQRAGEFVVTFPKAYHAGFNHGFNFNEAVNFALPDWLPFDRECVLRYQEHHKLPVFSHDELLVTVTQYSQSIKTALWLQPSLKEMIDRELDQRLAVRRSLQSCLTETSEDSDRPEDQYQCFKCNAFCYLSQVYCKCHPKVVCLEHADQVCNCSDRALTLRLRYTDPELAEIFLRVDDRATLPSSWQQKLHKALTESGKPLLRTLRALLAEGERISYNLPGLSNLRKCVLKANDWVEAANGVIARKQHRKRSRKVKTNSRSDVMEDVMERPERRIEEVYQLLGEVDVLGFDCPEVSALRAAVAQAEALKLKSQSALQLFQSAESPSTCLPDCEAIIAEGASTNIYLEELYDLERVVMQHKLLQDIADIDDSAITLDEVRALIARAKACELSPDNPQIKSLQMRQDAGDDWEEKAARILAQPIKTIEELEEFEHPESTIPIDPMVLDRLRVARTKGLEFERQANAYLHPDVGIPLPKVHEVIRLVTRAEKEFNIPAIRELRRTADFAVDLEQRCESVLKNRYRHRDEVSIFETMHDWVRYAREHLNKFQLPNFERLDEQLEAHDRWMERLPWYCSHHKGEHGIQVFDDVVQSTQPIDDMPPNDEYFTCICDAPVRPPPPGEASDAVQCDHCFARFHGVCARRGGSCPFCDHHHWNGTLRKDRTYHYCYMPTILMGAPEISKNYSGDWGRLQTIVQRIDRLSQLVGSFLTYASQPGNQRPELLPQVRHYMRRLYRIGFAVAPNPDVSYGLDLASLHRILADQPPPPRVKKTKRKPKFTFGQDVDQDWDDDTRCICRGRTRYLFNYPAVQCENCSRKYHQACVFYEEARDGQTRYMCPMCCLRRNRSYPNADIRVKFIEDRDPLLYVDVRSCVENYSKDLIKIKLNPPVCNTVFIDLVAWTPGFIDKSATANGHGSNYSNPPKSSPHYPRPYSTAHKVTTPMALNPPKQSKAELHTNGVSAERGVKRPSPDQEERPSVEGSMRTVIAPVTTALEGNQDPFGIKRPHIKTSRTDDLGASKRFRVTSSRRPFQVPKGWVGPPTGSGSAQDVPPGNDSQSETRTVSSPTVPRNNESLFAEHASNETIKEGGSIEQKSSQTPTHSPGIRKIKLLVKGPQEKDPTLAQI